MHVYDDWSIVSMVKKAETSPGTHAAVGLGKTSAD